MQRNKYLDNLGIAPEHYGTNFCNFDKRVPYWKKERKLYGFDSRETWNLDRTFIEWLYSHCMMFKEHAIQVIDLKQPVFLHNNVPYTLIEAIDYIIDATKKWLLDTEFNVENSYDKRYEKVKDAVHLWAEILPAMWW